MTERTLLITVILIAGATIIAGVFVSKWPSAKLISTGSGLLALASILQLRISGWLESVMAIYGDDEKFPGGPPSHITRQIIDDPDHPMQMAIRNFLFYEPATGVKLAVASILAAMIATWA